MKIGGIIANHSECFIISTHNKKARHLAGLLTSGDRSLIDQSRYPVSGKSDRAR